MRIKILFECLDFREATSYELAKISNQNLDIFNVLAGIKH